MSFIITYEGSKIKSNKFYKYFVTSRWIWQYYDNGFNEYDIDVSNIIEDTYQSYIIDSKYDIKSIKSGKYEYEIDFKLMLQTNIQNGKFTKRRIRRVRRI